MAYIHFKVQSDKQSSSYWSNLSSCAYFRCPVDPSLIGSRKNQRVTDKSAWVWWLSVRSALGSKYSFIVINIDYNIVS